MLRNLPIQRKLKVIILLTSLVVMALMGGAFIGYEIHELRTATARRLAILGQVIATNSTAALAFENSEDARDTLAALSADPHIIAAALYNRQGKLFAQYTAGSANAFFPEVPDERMGYHFESTDLVEFLPVVQKQQRLGTFYLRFDVNSIIREWIKTTFGIIAAVMVAVVFVAYLLARSLQKQISNPILSLAGTAKAISERRDYSLRAPKLDHAEIGLLTDAFNHMLAQIQEQNQSLRSNEAQLQTIIEHIGEGLIVCNLEGRLLHFNRAALEMHGFASIDECRCHFSDLARRFELSSLDGVILPIEQWPIACILRGELLHNVEVGVRRLSPAWQRTFEYGGTLVRNGANQPFMAVMTVSDITERKRVESVRSQLVAVVENSDDAIVTKTTEGIITSWNRGAETLFGYTVEEAVGRPMVMLFPPERVQEETEILAKMKRGENISHFETVRVRKDGKPLDVSISISPLRDGQGRIVGVSQIARDITERKLERVRLQFRAFFESLPGLYLVLTPDLKIMAVSDAYLKATMTTRDAILGRDLFDAFPDNPDDPHATGTSNLRASLDRVRQEGVTDTMAVQKYDVRRPDGVFEERFWSPVNSPVFGPDRRLEYIIHRVEDVTDFIRRKQQPAAAQGELQRRMERMEAEIFLSAQKVQLANQQLNAANQELEAFSYSVSHDLRAPLRHIDGFIGLLEKHAVGSLDDKGRRYLSVISEAARQMGRLIDDLLAFSRSGRTAMNPVEVDQDAMIAGIIRDGGFEKNGRSIEWRIAPLPRVRADSLLLRQVWFNLIDNAVKYSGKVPHPCIEIGCRKDEAAGAHEFFVRDNGVGFDMQYADKLFGVFQRLHAFTEFEGTGIGLANVRRIVVRHGGRTWAESRVGEGAVFYFSLPATESAPPADSLALSPTSSFS